MPLVNKISSGRIFNDEFDSNALNPIWHTTPTDPNRYSVNTDVAGHLRLKHGGVPFFLLMDMPNKDFVMEIKNDYLPVEDTDTAGIVVYKDAASRIELIEYFDRAQGNVNYTHMRVSKKGEVYTGYGSRDGGQNWNIIGTGTAQDMTKIGLVINGPVSANSDDFDVDYVRVYEDTRFIIANLMPGMRMEFLDANSNVIETKTVPADKDHLYFDLSLLPIPFNGMIRAYDVNGAYVETSQLQPIWGGDTFWYGLLVEVYYNGGLLPKDRETPLGHMINGVIDISVTIRNPGTEPLHNVTVSRSKYFQHPGEDWVQLADSGTGIPNYQNSVDIGTLFPGTSKDVLVRVKKSYTAGFNSIGDYKFLLEVSN